MKKNARSKILSSQLKIVPFELNGDKLEAREIKASQMRDISLQSFDGEGDDKKFNSSKNQALNIIASVYEVGADKPLFSASDVETLMSLGTSQYEPLIGAVSKANSVDVAQAKNG